MQDVTISYVYLQAGREDRPKFGGKKDYRQNPNASTTNKEKRKTKAFQMVKHKISRGKNNRSFRDKQVSNHSFFAWTWILVIVQYGLHVSFCRTVYAAK